MKPNKEKQTAADRAEWQDVYERITAKIVADLEAGSAHG